MQEEWDQDLGKSSDLASIISDSEEALSVRLALLQEAKDKVDIAYYAISNDETGRVFLSEILKAADCGVQIRIINDGKLGALSSRNRRALASHENIQMARFNPLNPLMPWTFVESLHDKCIIVDGKYSLSGGRNIGAPYFNLAKRPQDNKYDLDILLEKDGKGQRISAVDTLTEYFNLLWKNKATKRVQPRKDDVKRQKFILKEGEKFLEKYANFTEKNLQYFTEQGIRPERIQVLHNPIQTKIGRNEKWILDDLTKLLRNSKKNIYIETPYATATKPILEFLKESRNLESTYLTNSYLAANNLAAYPNYYYQRKKFLKTGVDIYEYVDEASLHGKALMMDEEICIIGSFNLDSRSVYLNTETMIVVESEEFTREFKKTWYRALEKSLKVGEENDYLPSGKIEKPEITLKKRILFFVSFVSLRLVQFFL